MSERKNTFVNKNKGGLEESFEIEKLPAAEKNRLWSIMYQGYSKNAIMGCSITVNYKQFFIENSES